MSHATADLCDAHSERLQIAEPVLRDFGGRHSFHGRVVTLKLFEDNSLVRSTLEHAGHGQVLVVDGGGSLRCAVVGDQLAALAQANGWAGLIVNGCVRDSAELAQMDIGIKALASHPLRSVKRGEGQVDIPVRFAGVEFCPGQYLYADSDGVIVATHPLETG